MSLLDAAVDELLAVGYSRLTTTAVAQRAQVSRGAQQHYFPQKKLLVAAAVRHLAERQVSELRDQAALFPEGHARISRTLDLLFEQYSGSLYSAMLELSLSARHDPSLRDVLWSQEREIGRELHVLGGSMGGEGTKFDLNWRIVLSTVRGYATLPLLGHDRKLTAEQWPPIRGRLIDLLTNSEGNDSDSAGLSD